MRRNLSDLLLITKLKDSKGFSVVEAVLSIALFSIVAATVAGSMFYAQQDTRYAGVKARATALAEEGLEAVQSIRDENYSLIPDPGPTPDTYFLSIPAATKKWTLITGTEEDRSTTGLPTGFDRQITIENITLPDVGSQRKITSTVTWSYLNRTGTVSLDSYMTNWRIASVTPLTAPTALALTPVSTSRIDLSWIASTGGNPSVAGYKIERALDSGGSPGTYNQIDTSATTSYNDTTGSVNTKYWYRVRAYDASGNNSDYSSTTGYKYKKAVTFNTTVNGADVALAGQGASGSNGAQNFPVAVHINSSSWPNDTERSNFFGSYNTSGKRISFYDSDETTALSYEVEYYDQSSQEAVYWVKVPQIDGNSSTDKIYIAYGNDPNGSNQDNPTAVWDSNFKVVYHMGDNNWTSGATALRDSTTNTQHSDTVTGTADIAGQIRRGRDFNGATDYITVPDSDSLDFTGNYTFEMWLTLDTLSQIKYFLDKQSVSNPWPGWTFRIDSSNRKLYVPVNGTTYGPSTTALTTGTLYHVAVTYNTSGTLLNFYLNGAADGTAAGATPTASTEKLNIGRYLGSGNYLDGWMDEIRIHSTNRSADWVKLAYYSMKKTNFNGDNGASSGKFINFGNQQNFSGSAITLANVPASPSATAASTSQLNVSWVTGGTQNHYHVKSSLNNYATNIYNSTSTSTSQSGLLAGTQYTYRIYGVNADDDESSTYATTNRYTLSDPPTLPVATDGTYPDKINVSWTASLTASSYKVYRDGISGTGTLVYNSNSTSFDDTITGSHTYYIYSINGDGVENSSYISDVGSTGSAASWATPILDTSLDVNHPGGTATTNAYDAYRIQVDGDYAYMIKYDGGSANYNDFFVINISGATPTIAGYTRVYTGTTALTLSNLSKAVTSGANKYVYVTTNNGSYEFARINVTNPAAPAATLFGISIGNYTVNRGIYAVQGTPPTIFIAGGTTSASALFVINGDTGATIKFRALTAGTSQAAEEVAVIGNRAYVSSDNNLNELQTIGNADGTATALTGTGNYNILTDGGAASSANALSIEGYNSGTTNTVLLSLNDGRLIKVNQNTSTNALSLGGSYNSGVTSNFYDISINNTNTLAFIGTSNTAAEFRVVTIATMASYGFHDISGTTAIGRGVAYHDTKDRAYMATQDNTRELYIVKPGP